MSDIEHGQTTNLQRSRDLLEPGRRSSLTFIDLRQPLGDVEQGGIANSVINEDHEDDDDPHSTTVNASRSNSNASRKSKSPSLEEGAQSRAGRRPSNRRHSRSSDVTRARRRSSLSHVELSALSSGDAEPALVLDSVIDDDIEEEQEHELDDTRASTVVKDDSSKPPSLSDKIDPDNWDQEEKKDGDVIVVDWDGPNDPKNPKNWAFGNKWAVTVVVSAFTLLT